MRTFGNLYFNSENDCWEINKAEPHVCIKLKAIFTKIPKGRSQPFIFNNLPETCHELLWFTERYPLAINENDLKKLTKAKKAYIKNVNELEAIMLPTYIPKQANLREGFKGMGYDKADRKKINDANFQDRILVADL